MDFVDKETYHEAVLRILICSDPKYFSRFAINWEVGSGSVIITIDPDQASLVRTTVKIPFFYANGATCHVFRMVGKNIQNSGFKSSKPNSRSVKDPYLDLAPKAQNLK